ncbi:MAG: hypothetical protein ACOX12_10020 [Eggerthellaceae bacterium]
MRRAASVVYLSVDGALAAAICISDPLRPESPEVVRSSARGRDSSASSC